MQVSEIMHKGIVSVNVNDTVKKVAELMKDEDVGAIPVMEKDRPVGFVTDRDIVVSCVAEGHSIDEPIANSMTKNIISVKEGQEVEEVARLMEENQVSRVLVVDNQQQPVGMVSLKDLSEGDEDLSEEALTRIKSS